MARGDARVGGRLGRRGGRDVARGRGRGGRGQIQGGRQPRAQRRGAPPRRQQPEPQQTQGGMPIDSNYVLLQGLSLVGFDTNQNVSENLNERRFRSHFGMGPVAVARLFDDLNSTEECKLTRLFAALNWLKLYDPEPVLAARWKLSEETLRVQIREYVKRICALEPSKIQWGPFGDENFIVSIDGMHCPIYEVRTDPSSKWYSHKFNGPGLCYELAIAIHSNNVVWLNGPFPASTHDITIFRSALNPPLGLMAKIPNGKRAIGDSGYKGEPTKVSITREDDEPEVKKFKGRIKSRQENFNGRLKNFRVLVLPFRHGHDNHRNAFAACCIGMQFEIENGNGLFEV